LKSINSTKKRLFFYISKILIIFNHLKRNFISSKTHQSFQEEEFDLHFQLRVQIDE
jgi:hypothetical protein